MPESPAAVADDEAVRRQLRANLKRAALAIHQPDDPPLFTREPQSPMRPMHWRWDQLQEYLEEIGQVLALRPGGSRRTLRLANPGLEWATTPTFWASIQYILPGEVATAHRHSPVAFRFVMYGSGCSTTVDGENYDMNAGDLVLTPSWAWHDHAHNGTDPMIWLDVLDISIMRKLDNIFFDPYTEATQPIRDRPEKPWTEFGSALLRPAAPTPAAARNPLLVYPKAEADSALEMAKELRPDPLDDVILEYQNPAAGGSALPSLSMKAQIIRPGFTGLTHRHSGSKVYWVIDGQGSTVVDGQRFDWAKGDFIAVPPWAAVRHLNDSEAEARLFRVDDSPLFRVLNVYHERIIDDEKAAPR